MKTSPELGSEPGDGIRVASWVGLWLRATVLDRPSLRERLRVRIFAGEGMRRDDIEVVRAAMEVAVRRYFGSEYDVRQVTGFVSECRRIYGEQMPSELEMEAFIRAALGESDVFVEDIDLGRVLKIGALVTSRVVRGSGMTPAEVEVVLVAAERMTTERGWHPAPHDGFDGTGESTSEGGGA